jgi:hypothetical protein
MRKKVLITAAILGTLLSIGAASAQAGTSLSIHVLSDRADLISGGEALVSVTLPSGVQPSAVKMTLDKKEVTSEFALRPNGSYEGLLTGLQVGSNVLEAKGKGAGTAKTTITDHAIGGPIFSGPQIKPWRCENTDATDAQCDAPPTYAYEYKSAVTGQLTTYEPSSPPSSALIENVTTETGQTVPFIIRTETGYEDRDQYKIAVLYQPGMAWEPWAPQPQFNHKLLITHGASCGDERESGTAPSVTSDTVGVSGVGGVTNSPTTALGLGFAVMSTALDNAGHDCYVVTEAESLIIAKEHLIDHYGTLRFTIGTGCSGGSLAQQQIANAYPGVYQGILPQCSFPDSWTTGQQLIDLHLTREYFEHPTAWGTGIVWTYTQIAAVEGHPNYADAVELTTLYDGLGEPESSCAGVESSEAFNAETNPGGVRCTLADYEINLWGPQPESMWNAAEKKAGHGFAEDPLDNVGVQYGLNALLAGEITAAEFVDLNSKIGGDSIELKPTPERHAATEQVLERAYRSGAVNEANNLKATAIIDLRGPDYGTFHDAYRSWAMRERLEQAEGHFPKNDVIWFGETPLIGSPTYTTEGLEAMNLWLSAVEADHRDVSPERKVAEDRPASVHDRCQVEEIEELNVPGIGPVCQQPLVESKFETPRMVAGESVATDQEKCQLEPMTRSSYYPVEFTEEEWAELQKAFPSGVCNFSKPGVEQQNTVPWQTYQSDATGESVVYGGKPLGPAPAGSGEGWSSESFSEWLK